MSQQDLQSLINACDQEPIHIPGSIQPYGVMLVFSPYFAELQQASANAAEFFAVESLWSATAHSLIDGLVLQQLHEGLQFGERVTVETAHYSYHAYVSGRCWVVEVETLAPHASQFNTGQTLQRALQAFREQDSPQGLLQTLTQQVALISGFERVMIYQFDLDWHGQVVAETTGKSLPSMLNHHFPASDLPAQARAMYSHNALRSIGSATAEPIPMHANPITPNPEAVDMSGGTLRGVSPVHLQYLQNLGVDASSSIGIFNEDRLWGIIALHHHSELWMHSKMRKSLRLVTECAAQRYFYLQQRENGVFQRKIHALRDRLTDFDDTTASFEQRIYHDAHGWLELIEAAGICYIAGDTRVCAGDTPAKTLITRLVATLSKHQGISSHWSSRNVFDDLQLGEVDEPDRKFAGLLAIPMSLRGDRDAWLLVFRTELVELKTWAGKPEKTVYSGLTEDMLGPRKSFEMWQQRIGGQSTPWLEPQIFAARDLARDLGFLTNCQLNVN